MARISIEDLEPLRRLPAFTAFELDVATACHDRGWAG